MKSNPKDVQSFMESHGFYRVPLDGHPPVWKKKGMLLVENEHATYWYEQTQLAVREARLDELAQIPVIETKGVGYEVIVKHRMKRFRELQAPDTKLTDREDTRTICPHCQLNTRTLDDGRCVYCEKPKLTDKEKV